ncbi:metallophosphoesterase [Microbacterium sp. K35]|uniref:metallophosphoesterase n=1 Tax=Microbacterium sp. K35 TaxID=2305440 RepID=UPI001443A263|nr:metallophosphoesterase [Microbacterium sp. K35]
MRRSRGVRVLGGVLAVLGGLVLASPAAITSAGNDERERPEPFTIVVLPDTQKYTVSDELAQSLNAQTQWIVDTREQLNTKFVIQVGDLVDSWPDVHQWERASRAMAILDDAGVPSSVLPGNHDLDVTTGESSTYDEYFPPSRYADATWNSATVSYGGYLGQDQFGQDGIDRQNKDNYSLLTVGDTKLLLLSLEYETPAYALEWAQRVIDAHPDRTVILAVHGLITTGGARSTATERTDVTPVTEVDLWRDFISQNCSIAMVVNGHWAVGDAGEARRSDLNACGRPVPQILSNYQGRANGGDGWLRYYTVDPAAGTVDAHTYSPTLRQYEKDDDGRFTLPLDLTPTDDRVLLRGGSDWKVWNELGAWPRGWKSAAFDDDDWQTGTAPLGWGKGVQTPIDLGPPPENRARAMLFRKTVELDDVEELSTVTVSTRADDGVAVWVNGALIGTSHLASKKPTSETFADVGRSTDNATDDPVTFTVPRGLLHDGENVVAASVHVNYLGTNSSTFDLVMTGRRSSSDGE